MPETIFESTSLSLTANPNISSIRDTYSKRVSYQENEICDISPREAKKQRRAVTEEAWRVVHACVQWTIHVTRCISHSGNATKRLQAPAMMREARKKLQELVAARWRRALIEKRTGEFRSNWVETGACLQAKGGSVKACALSRPGKKQPAQQHTTTGSNGRARGGLSGLYRWRVGEIL